MLTLLMYVLILGVIAYAVQHFPLPQPFQVVIYCILVIILIIVLFNALGTGLPGLNLRN